MGSVRQARIDKELTPVIKKTFAYHDKERCSIPQALRVSGLRFQVLIKV